jgi:hypothetical protein
MKHTKQLILVLTILGISLLPACGSQPSTEVTTSPNADHLIEFNSDGMSVLLGYVSGGFFCTSSGTLREFLDIEIPAQTEAIDVRVAVSFTLHLDTEISSSRVSPTDLGAYHMAKPDSGVFDAFPPGALVEVTFVKKEAAFEAIAVHEVAQPEGASPKAAMLDHILPTDLFSRGTVHGTISGSSIGEAGAMTWRVSVPITIQGIEAAVLLPVHSAADTQVVTSNGLVPFTSAHPLGYVQVAFTRKDDALIARQITEIP